MSAAANNIAPNPALHWRKVTIESDERTGEIVIQYSMPNGLPDLKRYPRQRFIDEGQDIVRLIAFHVCP